MLWPCARRWTRRSGVTLARDQRGLIYVEYAVVIALVGIGTAVALATIGPRTVANYSLQRKALYSHSP